MLSFVVLTEGSGLLRYDVPSLGNKSLHLEDEENIFL
jgi:hypothetical protein